VIEIEALRATRATQRLNRFCRRPQGIRRPLASSMRLRARGRDWLKSRSRSSGVSVDAVLGMLASMAVR